MTRGERIVRAEVCLPDVATQQGAHINDTVRQVMSRYPGQIKATLNIPPTLRNII